MGGEKHTSPSVSDQDYHDTIIRPENKLETEFDQGLMERLKRS